MFNIYVLLLIISGLLSLALAFSKVGAVGERVIRGIIGVGFLGYGLYLLLFFKGGSYEMFFYAFILPILLIVRFFQERSKAKAQRAAPQAQQSAQGQGASGW